VTKVTNTTTPNCPTAIFTTPRNRHQLHQQALAATSFFPSSPTTSHESYLAVVLCLADLTECALTEVEIAKAEAQKLREGYEGKRAAKADRRVLSKACIITGKDIIRLREERKAHDQSKPNQQPTKKKKPLRLLQPQQTLLLVAPPLGSKFWILQKSLSFMIPLLGLRMVINPQISPIPLLSPLPTIQYSLPASLHLPTPIAGSLTTH